MWKGLGWVGWYPGGVRYRAPWSAKKNGNDESGNEGGNCVLYKLVVQKT